MGNAASGEHDDQPSQQFLNSLSMAGTVAATEDDNSYGNDGETSDSLSTNVGAGGGTNAVLTENRSNSNVLILGEEDSSSNIIASPPTSSSFMSTFPSRPTEMLFRSSSSSLVNMWAEAGSANGSHHSTSYLDDVGSGVDDFAYARVTDEDIASNYQNSDNGQHRSSTRMTLFPVDESRASFQRSVDNNEQEIGCTSPSDWGTDAVEYVSHMLQNQVGLGRGIEYRAIKEDEDQLPAFSPSISPHEEWMGRSIESLTLGQQSVAPILKTFDERSPSRIQNLPNQSNDATSERLDNSLGGSLSPSLELFGAASIGSLPRESSIQQRHGDTMARYPDIQGGHEQFHIGRVHSERNPFGGSTIGDHPRPQRSTPQPGVAGPNVALSLLAREVGGRPRRGQNATPVRRLHHFGGKSLLDAVDKPAGGIVEEVNALEEAVTKADWTETSVIVSRLMPRLMGDPHSHHMNRRPSQQRVDDPTLPPNTSKFHAGGGRLGLERVAFRWAGGVQLFQRILIESAFVGLDLADQMDARDISRNVILEKAGCWNDVLSALRELVFAIPDLVHNGVILGEDQEFVPYLFTLLTHDIVFDGAASLIEEILSLQSHSPPGTPAQPTGQESQEYMSYRNLQPVRPAKTFFLGNVPELYSLWRGFSFRQMAHFCRILALLIFEPEDRQLLDTPGALKSMDLLQLRRDRVARAGRDATVDMNQAILLGDTELLERLMKLLLVMNYAPTLRETSVYHVMARFPFIADTLMMLGLSEMDNWRDVARLDRLARKLLDEELDGGESRQPSHISEIGAVSEMMDNLANVLNSNSSEPSTQLGHIIHVINAAQQAGVVVGRPRTGSRRRRRRGRNNRENGQQTSLDDRRTGDLNSVAEAAITLTDQVLLRQSVVDNGGEHVEVVEVSDGNDHMFRTVHNQATSTGRLRINTPEDAANELQFNALILAPYQVEVLFVLCTLLGGRRKIDAQNLLDRHGLIKTLDEMFHRLSWGTHHRRRNRPARSQSGENGDDDEEEVHGIHGPGCECTPESAQSVQYLRLLHNFCDRDCDNYLARRQMLSDRERDAIFKGIGAQGDSSTPGLFSKLVAAFVKEADDSPYRFWLASCAESFLRGSSPQEQLFAAQSGLLHHLIEDITSDRLHCAGSLQTSFDLLGELCKGNREVLQLLVSSLTEEAFRKLMSVASQNLVDSNVFIRSLLLSIERIAAGKLTDHFGHHHPWKGRCGKSTRFYLTHTWWDVFGHAVNSSLLKRSPRASEQEIANDQSRSTDWFPSAELIQPQALNDIFGAITDFDLAVAGHNGWLFSPSHATSALVDEAVYAPNTIERLSWFITTNQARLLRDLLSVVDLRNINHENICCLNTAVVVAIFAHRRHQLELILNEMRRMMSQESAYPMTVAHGEDSRTHSTKTQEHGHLWGSTRALNTLSTNSNGTTDVLRNFRELLWFWTEYYTHRGRDRLSLEFSSHIRFHEWKEVVSSLTSDDALCSVSLVNQPMRFPRSPYQRSSRLLDRGGRE